MSVKKNIYIILAIFGLVIASLAAFFVGPLMTQIQTNAQNLLAAKDNTAGFQVQNDEIINFKKEYDTLQPHLTTIDQLFVDPQNPVNFIKFLENTAINSQINSKNSLVPNSSSTNQKNITFQIAIIDANFINVAYFVEKLEQGPYLIEIENITTKLTEQGESESIKNPLGRVDATLTLNAFAK